MASWYGKTVRITRERERNHLDKGGKKEASRRFTRTDGADGICDPTLILFLPGLLILFSAVLKIPPMSVFRDFCAKPFLLLHEGRPSCWNARNAT